MLFEIRSAIGTAPSFPPRLASLCMSLLLLPSWAWLAGCSAAVPNNHPVQADKLRDVMRGFDDAVRTRVPAETDQYDRWAGVFPAIADAAAGLKVSARDLSGHPPASLELPDRGRFQVLGRSLEEAASLLEEAAARGDADAVSLARARVGIACRDCHTRYRPESPGVPDAFR